MSRCRKEKINLSLHDVLRSKSIIHLAECAGATALVAQTKENIDEIFDLSPIQQLYFQSATSHGGRSRFNQSFSLKVTKPINSNDLRRAVEIIVKQHSMLRARFEQTRNGLWKQRITEVSQPGPTHLQVEANSVQDINGSYRYRVHHVNGAYNISPLVTDSQMCLDIENGPIFAADLFNTRGDGQMVFLASHHLCVDMVSWRIVLQDLQEILEQGSLSMDKPLSFQSWTSMQAEHSKRKTTSKSLPFDVQPSNLGYWEMDGRRNTYNDVEVQSFTIDKFISETALGEANKALQTEPIDLFLSSIAHSFARVFSDREVPTLFNEGHGREPWEAGLDLSRTVGWFTTISPVHIAVDSGKPLQSISVNDSANLNVANGKDDVLDTLRKTKDVRRSIPDNGRPYFAQRFLPDSQGSRNVHSDIPMEIVFNYLGRMQQLERDDSLLQQTDFVDNEEDAKAIGDVGPDMARFALFEVSAIVLQNRIQFSFMFNRNMRRSHDIRRWICECKRTFEETVQSMARSSAEPTLSDYPLLPITYDGLKKVVKSAFPKAGINHRDQVEDIYPSSGMQEGILLSQLRDPNTYLFNAIFEAKDMRPGRRVDAQRIARAWQQVVDRHAALRTVFIDSMCRGSTFDQLVVKHADSGVIFINCNDSEAIDNLNATKLKDTNYKKSPKLPHQLTICSTTSGRVLVKTEINHAVIDGGSTAIMVRDLVLAYDNQLPEGPGPLYSDYIRYIRNQSSDEDLNFWKNYLRGIKPCYLPKLNSQTKAERHLSSVHMKFGGFRQLLDVCDRTKVTLSNVMHAAWAVVLRSYTGCDDVCFGYISAGRDAPVNGIQDTIGAFINMLCCRVQLPPTSPLDAIFQKVQEDFLDSLPYQRCSLAKVQHELGLAGKPLYNTALSIQNHTKSSDAVEENLVFETQEAHDPSEVSCQLLSTIL